MVNAADVTRRLGISPRDRSVTVACPVCQPEKRPDQLALSITVRAGILLLKCHKKNCGYRDILKAIGVSMELPGHPDYHHRADTDATACRDRASAMAEMQKKMEEDRAFRQKRAERAAVNASAILMKAPMTAAHPYMVRKGFARHPVPCISLKSLLTIIARPRLFTDYPDDALIMLVPLSIRGKLTSLQMIGPDGVKSFLAGAITKGASITIPGTSAVITGRIVCEGYATGLAAHYAAKHEGITSVDIICAMSANNMRDVARVCRATGAIADNDESGTGERAARALEIPFAMSYNTGEDFNDLWLRSALPARNMMRWLTTQTNTRRSIRYGQ